ncbi:DUF4942 domain-containing protein [Helicobacter sp. MIT 03-1614]|nr:MULTISPECIES: DUF4942 domain-containing protein [unclassified Helicobacter]TLD86479.1 DUF4942 domain-containing protein [Helicobacter sp. MIT 03-1614]TLD89702.1 DUF4942 domain-containing protein [Helicobacter sp. MIT 03-1616]
MSSLLDLVKQNNEDFEWYPTTNEMLDVLLKRIKEIKEDKNLYLESMLDIGAGDGRVLKYFDKNLRLDNIHAIEKSKTLIDSMDRNILVVGSDFNQTSLIEKTYDLVFCNPPYSSYKEWVMRILREINSLFIALVIPSRWQDDSDIKRVIESRKGLEYEVLESTDFLNAERSARAKVDIVLFKTIRVTDKNAKYGVDEDVFADNLIKQFNLQKLFDDIEEEEYNYKFGLPKNDSLEEKTYQVANGDLIEFLVSEYEKEYNEFIESLNHLNAINSDLLKCMNVDKKKLLKGIKTKLKDLKYLYWKELFSKLDAIRNRVTSTYAGYLHESVIVENNVDFNKDNIYSVVLWVIKNANKYIEKSYLSFFERMAKGENVLYYKSNQRFNIDSWRYANREDKSRTPNPYKLDYRIVLPRVAYLSYSSFYHDEDWTNFLRDLKVIGRNLGFYTDNITISRFKAGQSYKEWSGDKVLFEVKHYKNGNAHIKFSIEFMEKLNIQVGRINNWIKNKAEAREEFKNISDEELDTLFEKPIGISVGDSVKMLEMF